MTITKSPRPELTSSRRPLILAHLTLLHLAPPELISVAAAAGFDGVTLRVLPAHPNDDAEKPYPILDNSPMMRETLQRLGDTGLFVQDIEVIRIKPETDPATYRAMFEAGAQLGAKYVLTISDDTDEGRVASSIAGLGREAEPFGLKVAFEFMVYTGIKTIQQADRVLRMSGRPEAALMVDALHLARSGGSPSDVSKIDPSRLPYIQICDAPSTPLDDAQGGVRIEARRHRLLPGLGQLPIRELLSVVGSAAPLSIEAPDKDLQQRVGDAEVARLAIKTTRDIGG